MDYADYRNQCCPAAIHQTVSVLTAGAAPAEENLALNEISSTNGLSRDCFIAVMGQPGTSLARNSSADFKARYLGLVTLLRRPTDV